MTGSLIHHDGQVLAALDPSAYAYSVSAYAAWAANRLQAPLSLLHVLDREADASTGDLSGNLVLGDREALLERLTDVDAERANEARTRGRELLALARGHAVEQVPDGLAIDTRLRHGGLVDTLLELESEVRLFVIGKRGEHADFAKGHLGSNLERVVRAVHRPVLVASRGFKTPSRFMIAFDGSDTTLKCVEMVAASPLLKGLPCDLLTVGDAAPAGMDAAVGRLRAAGFDPRPELRPGVPDAAISAAVAERGIDLLVMGAYGHSRIRQLIVGSTTTQLLRTCTIPVLLLR